MSVAFKKFPECTGCLYERQPGPVFGKGDADNAKFVYIAQNPAYVEIEKGEPLVGPTGNIFNRQLTEAHIKRSEIYITNQVKCESPRSQGGAYETPPPAVVHKCRWILDRELARVKADTVVLAGGVPFGVHVGTYSTLTPSYHPSPNHMERMGCVEVRNGRKWIATPHPSFIMRMPKMWEAAVEHLRKAYVVSGRKLEVPKVEVWPDDKRVQLAVEEIREAKCFSDDFETAQSVFLEEDDYIGGDQEPTMLGVSWKPRHAILIKPSQVHLLNPVLQSSGIWRFEHNGAFDDYYMRKLVGSTPTSHCFDTMAGRHYLASHLYKRLKPDCIASYTHLPYYNRDLAKLNEPLYCGMDAMGTFESALIQLRMLKQKGLWEVFWKYGQPLIQVLEEWRQIGINTDIRKALLFRKIIETRIQKAEMVLAKIVGPSFNSNSYPQMRALLYEHWKLPVQTEKKKDKKTGIISQKISTSFEAKKRLKWWIDENQERQEKFKIPKYFLDLTDYLEGEQAKLDVLERISPDGRIHAHVKMHGALSFRLATSPNVQNIPKHDVLKWGTSAQEKGAASPLQEKLSVTVLGSLRSVVIPDLPEEDWLLTTDYEQIELWVYAVQFNCKWLLAAYNSGDYIYGTIYEKLQEMLHRAGKIPEAKKFFEPGKPRLKRYKLKTVTESELKHCKAVPLGFLYGRDATAVAHEYGIPVAEAEMLRNWWFGLNPELLQAYDWIKYQVRQHSEVRLPFGQIIHFPGQKLTEAYNAFGQSPAAFVLLGTILQVTEAIRERRAKTAGIENQLWNRTRLVLSVHDSITYNVPGPLVEEFYEQDVATITSRPIPELKNYVFRHTADVSKMWDWDEIPYEEWKELHGSQQRGAFRTSQNCVECAGGPAIST